MCDLCSRDENEKKSGRDQALQISEDLRKASALYYNMAMGKIKPHTDEVKPLGRLARSIIREFVNEWI